MVLPATTLCGASAVGSAWADGASNIPVASAVANTLPVCFIAFFCIALSKLN
ncbi:MAG: hypothetical protein RJA36_3333 [Pseudomonadota bacterium]|jgi:hypothetical protein